MRSFINLISIFIFTTSWANDSQPINYKLELTDSTLSIMSYNVENLFDTEHDANRNDWEFLPLKKPDGSPNRVKIDGCKRLNQEYQKERCLETDWTNERLQIKLQKIAEVVQLQGDSPDILALVEIENKNVLEQLANVLGYAKKNVFISTGNDQRGINVALLYRDRVLTYQNHSELSVSKNGRNLSTRNILTVNFKVKGTSQTLGVFVNHWPSQANDISDRIAAAETLNVFVEQQKAKWGKDYHSIALGDFNVTAFDRPHPIIETVEGKKDGLKDSLVLLKKKNEDLFYKLPTGSYFYSYAGSWDYLDKILISPSLLTNAELQVDILSFRILGLQELSYKLEVKNPSRHTYGNTLLRVPNRFNFKAINAANAGYSDHYPVRIVLDIRTR